MTYLGVEYGTKFVLEGPNGQKAVFNDSTDPDYVGDLDPESSGLDAPEIREDSNDRVESDGSIFGDFFSGKRPIVLQGRIIASSKTQRAERIGKLRAASNAKTTDATLWWEDPLGGKVFVNVRRQQPLRITKGWVKEFQLALVSADSRILSYATKTGTAKGITTGSQEKFPTEAAPLVTGKGNPGSWVNPTNIKASDNAYATNAMPKPEFAAVTAQPIYGRNYGFTLPSTVIVTGVEVRPEHKATAGSAVYPLTLFLSRDVASYATILEDEFTEFPGGVKYVSGDFEQTFLGTTDATTAFGGQADMWRYRKFLTTTIVNSNSFGAAIQYATKSAQTISVDALPIKVYYAEPLKVIATNDGSASAPAIIKVKGPLENFYVLNQTSEEILTYSGKVESGKEIWFDTENVTVTERGAGITEPINRFANVGLPNDWIRIQPGANTILVAGLGGNANTELAVEYRNAWE